MDGWLFWVTGQVIGCRLFPAPNYRYYVTIYLYFLLLSDSWSSDETDVKPYCT